MPRDGQRTAARRPVSLRRTAAKANEVAPHSPLEARFDWFTNVKLADRKGVGIDWTSSNLNHPWFGGSRFIPNKDTCNGPAWRKLIVDGLMQASTGLC